MLAAETDFDVAATRANKRRKKLRLRRRNRLRNRKKNRFRYEDRPSTYNEYDYENEEFSPNQGPML